jgi:hypothetical protein
MPHCSYEKRIHRKREKEKKRKRENKETAFGKRATKRENVRKKKIKLKMHGCDIELS